jgi:predicted transcriptional regulator
MKETSETSADWWDDLSESQKASIEKGLKHVGEGKITSHEDAKARYGL